VNDLTMEEKAGLDRHITAEPPEREHVCPECDEPCAVDRAHWHDDRRDYVCPACYTKAERERLGGVLDSLGRQLTNGAERMDAADVDERLGAIYSLMEEILGDAAAAATRAKARLQGDREDAAACRLI